MLLLSPLVACATPVSLTLVREWCFKKYLLLSRTCATKCSRVTCMPAGRYRRCCRSSLLLTLNWCTCYTQLTPFDSPLRPGAYEPRGWPGRQKETSTQVAGCLEGERRTDADCHRWCQWGQRVFFYYFFYVRTFDERPPDKGPSCWKTTSLDGRPLIKDHPVERPLSLMEDH